MNKVIIFVHGKGGNHLEANQYVKNCEGFHIVGVNYNEYLPWIVQKEIMKVYYDVCDKFDEVYLLANSIGSYFSMHSLQNCNIKKALFISPVVNMESLILDMLKWAGVTEIELQKCKEIQTNFDETLSWKFLTFVRANPMHWDVPTEILYGEKDHLVTRQTIDRFVLNHNANLTVMKDGEHWFHTYEQLDFLNEWMKEKFY